jgi:hypothetical protein
MRIWKFIAVLIIIWGVGCASSFNYSVKAVLDPAENMETDLFYIVDDIAQKYSLYKDDSNSIPGEKITFMGDPYHYYTFQLQKNSDSTLSIEFNHWAITSKSNFDFEPEQEFLKTIKTIYPMHVHDLEYNFTR